MGEGGEQRSLLSQGLSCLSETLLPFQQLDPVMRKESQCVPPGAPARVRAVAWPLAG